MIRIENLSKWYGGQQVLSDITLSVARGKIHGLLGISGAGKSTLLRCVNGLEPYDSGSLKVSGLEVGTLRGKSLHAFRKKIGMIFQDFALLERKTVLENVLLPMQCWHYPKNMMRGKAMELLELVGIADKVGFRPAALSGGQKQRVAIARTLALDPEILLCDEATSALDPLTTRSVLDLIKRVTAERGITTLVVTHQMHVVQDICDDMSVMGNGVIAVTGRVRDIFSDEPPELQRLTGSPEVLVPEGKQGLKITLGPEAISQPIFSDIALHLRADFTMLHAQTDTCNKETIGHFYIAVQPGDAPRLCDFLARRDVRFSSL